MHTNELIRREPWRAAVRLAGAGFRTFVFSDADGLSGYSTVEIKLGEPAAANRNELYDEVRSACA